MTIFDISPVISSKIAVWPGDTPFQARRLLDMQNGDNLTLGSIDTTVHLGAHADARNHYIKTGVAIADHPLEPYLGHAQVITVRGVRGRRILPTDLPTPINSQRVLLKTETFPDPDVFNEDFAALSPELVEHCAGCGVQLIGIDTPSIDLFSDSELICHNAIVKAGLYNLEGIVLSEVPDGFYELIALPLRIANADASPVRAVLRAWSPRS